MDLLEKRYRRLLRVLPARHRHRYGEEMVGTALDAAAPGRRWPGAGDAVSLLFLGLRLRVVDGVADDLRTFFLVPARRLRERGLRAVPLTATMLAITAFLATLAQSPDGMHDVVVIAGRHEGDPWWLWLLHCPLSILAPAPMLPWWAAMLQVGIACGTAECWLTRRRLLTVVIVAALAAPRSADRLFAAVSWLPGLATPQPDAYQLETGPTIAVIALSAYLAVRLRTYFVVAMTALGTGCAMVAVPELVGRGQLFAIGVGIVLAVMPAPAISAYRHRGIRGLQSDIWERDVSE